ncbi:unnamed protein product [Haemonchus placei]|uniref:ZP domain-containing protein n=1 Tax=Haemonchus placei TaxID=6290 RepID=A0A158QK60_HAEPC|nr:unnamed protein product [Haemonchus placei]
MNYKLVVYDPSLSSAYMVVEAFVFPDRSNVQFQCQVQVCDRRDNECLGVTPPNCPLMTRNEFLPTSIIEASVNPTQGTLQTAIGNTILDEDLRLPAYAPEYEPAYPWRKEQDDMGEDNNSTESSQSTMALETPNVEARQTTLKMLTTEPTPEETSDDQVLPTQMNQLDWTIPQIPEIGDDHPLEIFVRSTSATPILQSERSGRRLADQIIDVMSEELTLRTADDAPSREAARLPPTTSSTHLTCLNQTAVLAMCAAFAMTIVLSIVLLLYILRDVCRG